MKEMTSEVELDEIEVKILGALIRSARTKLKRIAEECELSSNVVFIRIKHLKIIGVIVEQCFFLMKEKLVSLTLQLLDLQYMSVTVPE
jgi:DNA-binding Lrp family transcriptional regulator